MPLIKVKEYAQQEPQRQGVFQKPPVRTAGDQPGDGQEGVDQEHDMKVIQVLLMPEQQQIFHRCLQVPGVEAARQRQEDQLVARRPEKQRRQRPGKGPGIELFQRQLPFRRQEKRAAGHQEQRDAGVGQAGPEEGRKPLLCPHDPAGEGSRRCVAEDYVPNSDGLDEVDGLVTGRRALSPRRHGAPPGAVVLMVSQTSSASGSKRTS